MSGSQHPGLRRECLGGLGKAPGAEVGSWSLECGPRAGRQHWELEGCGLMDWALGWTDSASSLALPLPSLF